MYFYFHIVHLKGCRVLYLPKCAVFAGFPANTVCLGKYSTLGNGQVRLFNSSALSFASITIAELKTYALYRVEGKDVLPLAVYHSLLPSLPFAAINNWFHRNFRVSRLFFSWLRETIASYTTIHSGCPITIALHRALHLYLHQYNKPVKALLREWQYGKNNTRAWSRA